MIAVICPVAAAAQVVPPAPNGSFSVVFRGAGLEDALKEVVALTGIDLVYNAELIGDRRVYCARREVPADVLLRCVLEGTGLDYVRSSSGAYILIVARKQQAPAAALAGRIIDSDSGAPLPHAHVLLADAGTVTDADGYFTFAGVRPGAHHITATYVGYEAAVTDELWMAPGSRERVTIALRPVATHLSPVVIDGLTQRLPSWYLGSEESLLQADATPGFMGTPDVMRGAAATMGVSSALPLADLHIQGGNTTEHVTRLDGVPVRDPVSLGRYLGAFSPLAIGSVTVHKAGFGVQHGSLISGAIDVRHDLGARSLGVGLQVDPVSANVRLSTPLAIPGTAGGSALIAFRRSMWEVYQDPGTSDLLRHANQIDPLLTGLWLQRDLSDAGPRTSAQVPEVAFSDAHAAFDVRPDPYSTVSGTLFRAGNFVAADHRASLPGEAQSLNLDFRDVYDWTNWAGQLRYSRLLGARAIAAVRTRGSVHRSSYDYDYGAELPEGGTQRPSDLYPRFVYGAAHELTELGLDAELSYSLAPGTEVEAGLSADWIEARFVGENPWIAPFEIGQTEVLGSAFAHGRIGVGPRLFLEGGVRVTGVGSSWQVYAEPRAAARYDGTLAGTDGYAFRLAAGLYRQFVNGFQFRSAGPAALVPELGFWLPPGPDVAPPRAGHLALDGMLLLRGGLTIRGEAFARFESHALVLNVPALKEREIESGSPAVADIVSGVRGRALGGSLGVQWEGEPGNLGITYSIEQARRSHPARDDDALLSVPWEEPHRLSIDGRMALGKGVSVAAAARGIWGRTWGLRQAYFDFLNGDQNLSGEQLDRPDLQRLPALVLVDAKFAYRPQIAAGLWRIEIGVANLLDRANVLDWSLQGPGEGAARIPRLLPGRRLTFAVRVDV